MTTVQLRRPTTNYGADRVAADLVDLNLGNRGGMIRLRGYDGDVKGIGGGTAGTVLSSNGFPINVQSPIGLHAVFPLSSTPEDDEPTLANSAVQITDDGLSIGAGKTIRLYETSGSDYTQVGSDADGGLVVGGSGASAGYVSALRYRVREASGTDYAELTSADGLLLVGGTGAYAGSVSLGALAATAGVIRLPNGAVINGRNLANTQNVVMLSLNAADQVFCGDTVYSTLTAVQSATAVRLTIGGVDVVSVTAPEAAVTGNLTLVGVGRRILGDFSNATAANRVLFQSSTPNTSTVVAAIPNGTNTTAGLAAYNASNPGAASYALMLITSAEMQITSSHAGASFLPMSFLTSNVRRLAIDAAGAVTVTAINPPTSTLQVTGGSQAKAWAFVTGGGGATLGDSYNVSGVVRNGAGDFTVSWNRDFTSGGYALVVALQDNGSNLIWRINGQAAGSADIHFRTTAGVLTDPDGFSVVAFGSLV
jgi:hypothetical protein